MIRETALTCSEGAAKSSQTSGISAGSSDPSHTLLREDEMRRGLTSMTTPAPSSISTTILRASASPAASSEANDGPRARKKARLMLELEEVKMKRQELELQRRLMELEEE